MGLQLLVLGCLVSKMKEVEASSRLKTWVQKSQPSFYWPERWEAPPGLEEGKFPPSLGGKAVMCLREGGTVGDIFGVQDIDFHLRKTTLVAAESDLFAQSPPGLKNHPGPSSP